MSYRESIVREYTCDGCNEVSPPNGLNDLPAGWMRITTETGRSRERTSHVCGKCQPSTTLSNLRGTE